MLLGDVLKERVETRWHGDVGKRMWEPADTPLDTACEHIRILGVDGACVVWTRRPSISSRSGLRGIKGRRLHKIHIKHR